MNALITSIRNHVEKWEANLRKLCSLHQPHQPEQHAQHGDALSPRHVFADQIALTGPANQHKNATSNQHLTQLNPEVETQ